MGVGLLASRDPRAIQVTAGVATASKHVAELVMTLQKALICECSRDIAAECSAMK